MNMRLATLQLFQKSTAIKYLWFPRLTEIQYSPNLCSVFRVSFRNVSSLMMDSFSNFNLYRNLQEILEDLSKYDNIQPVQQLLQIYNKAKAKCDEQKGDAKYPLIILEGLDGSGKSSMTKAMARKIKAEKWVTPPNSIKFLRDYFDNNSALRTSYYSLGNYIAALEVSCVLHSKPVLMDRFWHSTTAYALAQCVANRPQELKLPDPSDDIYKWPADLLKPDKVILLNVSEDKRLERHSRRGEESVTVQEKLLKDDTKFREDVVRAYKNMREPAVTVIDGDASFGTTLYRLLNNVKPLLETK